MAIIPKNTYPGQTIGNDPNYPHGKARNIAVPGDRTGTPWEEQLVNDLWGFCQALLARGGVTPNGFPDDVSDSDYVKALNNAYASTMQDALNKSFAAGDNPTMLLPGGNSMDFASNRTISFRDGVVYFWKGPDLDEAIRLAFGAKLGFDADDGVLAFSVGAPASATRHGITTPAAPNTTSKAAFVRAPGTDTQAAEWMPMDWGDTDGGGSGWTATVSNVTGTLSNVLVTHGKWSRSGGVVDFSIYGTADSSDSGKGDFTVGMPPLSGSITRVAAQVSAVYPRTLPALYAPGHVGRGAIDVTIMRPDDGGGAAAMDWTVTGQFKVS